MALIKHGNNALSSVTAFPSAIATGKLKLLSTATASSSSSIEFTSGIDNTYDVYQFEFVNIHTSTDGAEWQFNLSTDGGSNYNVTKTSTFFQAFHDEANTATSLNYVGAQDLAQSTSDQVLITNMGTDNDQSLSGTLQIFNPSSSVFVKHFMSNINHYLNTDYSVQQLVGGYGNTTSAVDAVIFRMSSGTIDTGSIKMYGISA